MHNSTQLLKWVFNKVAFNENIIPGGLKLRMFWFFKDVRLKLFPEPGTLFLNGKFPILA